MSELSARSKQIRRDAIVLANDHGGTHFGGSMSCVEILISLYDYILREDDVFILSKGHSCWPYYVILREKGFRPRLECHPHLDVSNGIWCTTGSLGHGFPFGLGIALSKKIKKEYGRVFVLMGDGECQEGTTWESLLIASANYLDNVVVIVDNNRIQGSDFTDHIVPVNNLEKIAELCGWEAISINGHDIETLIEVLRDDPYRAEKPLMIIANTTKGFGVQMMEDVPAWHSKPMNEELEKIVLKELE